MTLRKILGTTAILAAFAIATPAMAQDIGVANGTQNDNNDNNDNNDTNSNNDNNDTGSNNDNNDTGSNNDNNDFLSNNDNNDNNGNDRNNEIANDFLDLLSNNSNGNNRDNQENGNIGGNSGVTAVQSLIATNLNQHLDEVVDLDGEDNTDTNVGYQSGDNYVRGNAFAAFAGINSSAWNTGINNNVQSGVNIAAQGNVSFGDAAGCCPAPGNED